MLVPCKCSSSLGQLIKLLRVSIPLSQRGCSQSNLRVRWSIENRLAMMQMAMTTRLILQTIKSLAVGEQASSDAIGEQSSSDVDGNDHETRFAED
ncbi:hypothetical protein Taro_020124 [Colocasia esculenta]|uniref:Uncharacterized protein n=1 Tax=Colocasia esculenta TaxID=4460 RepID=A0A843V176_COLES|nr:hypothetical protein [Colocasia esculenta]